MYDHFHTTPGPERRRDARGVDAHGRVRRGDRADPARARCARAWATAIPAYLAKVAATVDIVSGGRVEMGIGGGWYEHEWRAYGYGFPRAGDPARRCSTRACRSCAQPWDDRHGHARRRALPGRRRDRAAASAAGRRHPAVDRRRRREEDAAHRGEVRAVHELRRDTRTRSSASPRSSPSTARRSAPTSTRSSGRATTTS